MMNKAAHSIRVEETVTREGHSFIALANNCMFIGGLVQGKGATAYEAVCDLALSLSAKIEELRLCPWPVFPVKSEPADRPLP
jgi:hypothetical protein